MAKKSAKHPTEKQESAATRSVPPKTDVLDPKRVHELFGLPGPYETPPPPIATKSYVTWWDCGISINELRRRQKTLFLIGDWLDSQRFAKESDSWKWRLINPTPLEFGKPFEEQYEKVPHGSDIPLDRELVVYLVLQFLQTGERPEIPRLRCRDVLPSGRRVCVGPFHESGLEIANVSDRWASPGIGLCSIFTPAAKKK